MTTIVFNNVRYHWEAAFPAPETLYGEILIPMSLVPHDAMTMTLRTVTGKELVIRGELIEDRICFFHVTMAGEIGCWVPMSPLQARLRDDFALRFGGREIGER